MRTCLYLLAFIFLFSCGEKSATTQCKYFEGLDLYMQRIHNINIKDVEGDKIFYFLSLRGCEPCIDKNLNMLSGITKNKNLIICLIGKLELMQYEQTLNLVTITHTPILDLNGGVFSYETGLSKPLLMHIRDGKCVDITNVSDNEVDRMATYILDTLELQ